MSDGVTLCYREMHPGWEYRLWTDTENRELVQEHYPWLLQTYDRLPGNIMRADMARIMYLHQFGGWSLPNCPYCPWTCPARRPMNVSNSQVSESSCNDNGAYFSCR